MLLYETKKKVTTELLRDHFIYACSLFKGILPASAFASSALPAGRSLGVHI